MDIKAINSAIVTGSFTAEQLDSISDAVKFARSRVANSLKFTLTVGSKVRVNHAKLGGVQIGTVKKIKIKKADVYFDGLGQTFNVPLAMLSAA